jgi:hypothetical protein
MCQIYPPLFAAFGEMNGSTTFALPPVLLDMGDGSCRAMSGFLPTLWMWIAMKLHQESTSAG